MSDKSVSLGQIAQLLVSFGRKGFGPRELTLFGQATPEQLEECYQLLTGRAKLEPIGRRWWREGEDVIVPYTNESRSGPELIRQNPEQFGPIVGVAGELLRQIDRIEGRGELVIVQCPFVGDTFEEVISQLLSLRDDLEPAPQAAALQLTTVDVAEIGVPIVIASKPMPRESWREVLCWGISGRFAQLQTCATSKVGREQSPWWTLRDKGYCFLLKRKAG